MWFVSSGLCFYYVYILLTFNIFEPETVGQNFRENVLAVITVSLTGAAFIIGGIGVLLRNLWARSFSFFLCALIALYAVAQMFNRNAFNPVLEPNEIAILLTVSLPIFVWLVSGNGRTYFRQVDQPA